MPKIITPQQRQTECLRHLKLAEQAIIDARLAIANGESVADTAKIGEAAFCYLRRSDGKLPEAGPHATPKVEPATFGPEGEPGTAFVPTQALKIVGPNLPGPLQALGTFHVHTADCADLKRGAIRRFAEQTETSEHTTLVGVAEYIYDNGIMGEDETGENYLFDFHFAPCVKLPVK
jgi:hypothetical protein